MTEMLVIVPSRNRPENIRRLLNNWPDDVDLLVAVDDDDPKLAEYQDLPVETRVGPRLRLGPTLNAVAREEYEYYNYIGFMGDDHLPRTEGWQHRIQNELERLQVGFVYGNDLFQGEKLPTAVFMTTNVVEILQCMCPTVLTHMYLDDAWLAWGKGIDRITYMPDVIIEHIHPAANKVSLDAGYQEADSFMTEDRQKWLRYCESGCLEFDILMLKGVIDGMETVS